MPYQFDLEKVIKDNGIESLVKKAELVEPNLKENINQIIDSYSTHRTNCDAIAQQVLMSILRAEDLKKIHSARYRVKAMDSLAVKIIKKKAELPKEPSNIYDIEKTGKAQIIRNKNASTLTLVTCRHNTNRQIIVICELQYTN